MTRHDMSNIYKSLLLILMVLIACNSANAQRQTLRPAFIQTLQQAKVNIDQLIATNPEKFGIFTEGVINEDSLSLEYYVEVKLKDPASPKTQPQDRKLLKTNTTHQYFKGVRFRLYPQILRPEARLYPTYSWLALNTYLVASWSWPNRSFGFDLQSQVMGAFEQACKPLFQKENEALTRVLGSNHPESIVLEGEEGVNLKLSSRVKSNQSEMTLLALSESQIHIDSRFEYHFIVNDSLWPASLPKGFILKHITNKNPFERLNPNEPLELKALILGRLPEGEHRIRVIAAFDSDTWVDVSPTFVDGQPVTRKVKPAWVGRIVSNEIKAIIGPNGELLEIR